MTDIQFWALSISLSGATFGVVLYVVYLLRSLGRAFAEYRVRIERLERNAGLSSRGGV